MRRYKFTTFMGEAIKGIYRNPLSSTVSIISLVLALLVMGTFWLLKVNIDYNLESLGDFHKIVVYLDLDASSDDAEKVRAEIKDIVGVSDDAIEFTTKQQALILEKEKYGEEYAYIFDSYKDGANPLPDSFTVSYPENTKDLEYIMQRVSGIEKVESAKNRKDIADKITNLKDVVNHVSTALLIMLFIVSIFVIGNTVKLTHEARKSEIKIMRYIGATNFFIEFPFVLEGVILGIISAAVGFVIQTYAYTLLAGNIAGNYGNIVKLVSLSDPASALLPNVNYYVFILGAFLIVGLLTGVLGTLTTRKHLKA